LTASLELDGFQVEFYVETPINPKSGHEAGVGYSYSNYCRITGQAHYHRTVQKSLSTKTLACVTHPNFFHKFDMIHTYLHLHLEVYTIKVRSKNVPKRSKM